MFFPIYMPLGSPTKSPSDLKKTLGSHDLEVSMLTMNERVVCLLQAFRVLRPGGR